jgi:hypothetical protein
MFGLGYSTRVLLGSEVDMSDAAVLRLAPRLSLQEVRACSYPAAFYRHVRSNLVHEFTLSDNACTHFATRLAANVSYVNRYDPKTPVLSRPLIHFHIEWVAAIATSIARNASPLVEKHQPAARPVRWWIES